MFCFQIGFDVSSIRTTDTLTQKRKRLCCRDRGSIFFDQGGVAASGRPFLANQTNLRADAPAAMYDFLELSPINCIQLRAGFEYH